MYLQQDDGASTIGRRSLFAKKEKDQKCHAPIGELIISPAAGCPPCRIYVSRSGSHRGKLVDVFIYIYICMRGFVILIINSSQMMVDREKPSAPGKGKNTK